MTERLHSFDAMRAIGATLVLATHSAAGYSSNPIPQWPHLGKGKSILFDAIAWTGHMCQESLFFFLAGFFACKLLSRVTTLQFIKSKFYRILIPFLLFGFFFNLPVVLTLLFSHKARTVQDILIMFSNLSYMWFLQYLLIYYCLYLIFAKMSIWKKCRFAFDWQTHSTSILLLISLIYIALLGSRGWFIPIFLNVVPDLWLLGLYGVFFLQGVYYANNFEAFLVFFKWRWHIFLLGILFYSINAYLMLISFPHREITLIFYAGACYLLFFSIVAACQRFLNVANQWLQLMAGASYWLYLIQIYLVLLFQYYFSSKFDSVYVQFTATYSTTLLVALISYQLFLRNRRQLRT